MYHSAASYKHLYGTHRWKVLSKRFLATHRKCVFCYGRSEVTDHKVPHKGDERLFFSIANLQACCKQCHDSVKARLENGKIAGKDFVINNVADEDGIPLSDNHPWNAK